MQDVSYLCVVCWLVSGDLNSEMEINSFLTFFPSFDCRIMRLCNALMLPECSFGYTTTTVQA